MDQIICEQSQQCLVCLMITLDLEICLKVTVPLVNMFATRSAGGSHSEGQGPGRQTPQFPNSHIRRVHGAASKSASRSVGEGLLGAQPPPQ